MTSSSTAHGRVLAAALFALLMAAGCVVPTTDSGAGGAGGSGGATTTTSVLSGTDAEVCGAACQALITCGAELTQAGCKDSCVDPANTALVTCLRTTTGACNDLSLCVWATICGAAPGGGASCGGGQECLISCAGNGNPSCGCGCAGQVSASAAITLYVLATCTSVHCSAECATTGDPSSCNSCMANECSAADSACL